MWLIILALAAVLSTAIWYSKAEDDKYMLKILCLILWGATIMVLVDHVMGCLMEGGEFLEITPEATALGFVMLTAAFVLWEIILLVKDPKGVIRKKVVSNVVGGVPPNTVKTRKKSDVIITTNKRTAALSKISYRINIISISTDLRFVMNPILI